jgi:hypothetical protein
MVLTVAMILLTIILRYLTPLLLILTMMKTMKKAGMKENMMSRAFLKTSPTLFCA